MITWEVIEHKLEIFRQKRRVGIPYGQSHGPGRKTRKDAAPPVLSPVLTAPEPAAGLEQGPFKALTSFWSRATSECGDGALGLRAPPKSLVLATNSQRVPR